MVIMATPSDGDEIETRRSVVNPPIMDPLDRTRELESRVSLSVVLRVGGRLVTMALTATTLAVLSRYLGVREFGYYVTATSLLSLVWVLADGGIVSAAVRESARTGVMPNSLADDVVGARLLASVVAGAVAIGVAVAAYGGRQGHVVLWGTAVLLVTMPVSALSGGFQTYAESRVRIGYLVLSDIVGRGAALAAVAAVAASDSGTVAVFTGQVAASLMMLLLLTVAFRRRVRVRVRWGKSTFRLMRRSWTLGLAVVLNAVYFRADAVLLSLLRGAADVAYYGIAYRILEFVLALGAFLLSAMLPVLTSAAVDPSGGGCWPTGR